MRVAAALLLALVCSVRRRGPPHFAPPTAGTYKGLRAIDGSFLQEPQCPQRLTLTYQSGAQHLPWRCALYNFLIYRDGGGGYKKDLSPPSPRAFYTRRPASAASTTRASRFGCQNPTLISHRHHYIAFLF
jgi:hypothetical protein